MKKVIAFLCVASMAYTFIIPSSAVRVAPVGGGENIEVPREAHPLMEDVIEILKFLSELIELSEAKQHELDFNNDGKITIDDAVLALRVIAGLAEFPERDMIGETTAPTGETSAPEATAGEPEATPELPEVTTAPEAPEVTEAVETTV